PRSDFYILCIDRERGLLSSKPCGDGSMGVPRKPSICVFSHAEGDFKVLLLCMLSTAFIAGPSFHMSAALASRRGILLHALNERVRHVSSRSGFISSPTNELRLKFFLSSVQASTVMKNPTAEEYADGGTDGFHV
ncbi:MAG: hypothetical protein K5657_06635, partial [Desulfovibrio sp.]|nr:hypothetical protein [Desulfovibrio sp.]